MILGARNVYHSTGRSDLRNVTSGQTGDKTKRVEVIFDFPLLRPER